MYTFSLSFYIFLSFFPSDLIIGLDFVLVKTRNPREEIECNPTPFLGQWEQVDVDLLLILTLVNISCSPPDRTVI